MSYIYENKIRHSQFKKSVRYETLRGVLDEVQKKKKTTGPLRRIQAPEKNNVFGPHSKSGQTKNLCTE